MSTCGTYVVVDFEFWFTDKTFQLWKSICRTNWTKVVPREFNVQSRSVYSTRLRLLIRKRFSFCLGVCGFRLDLLRVQTTPVSRTLQKTWESVLVDIEQWTKERVVVSRVGTRKVSLDNYYVLLSGPGPRFYGNLLVGFTAESVSHFPFVGYPSYRARDLRERGKVSCQLNHDYTGPLYLFSTRQRHRKIRIQTLGLD